MSDSASIRYISPYILSVLAGIGVLSSGVQSASAGQIMHGVNGHPVQGSVYAQVSGDQQFALMASIGLRSYRMDLYDASSSSMRLLSDYVALGKAYGIQILPALTPERTNYADEQSAYDYGYALASAYAGTFSASDLPVWELGNEYDLLVGTDGDGSVAQSYANQPLYPLIRGVEKGMIDGLHAGNPAMLAAINNAGWCHYGFQQQLLNDGLSWDITTVHWYESDGNITNAGCGGPDQNGPTDVLGTLQAWGRPIWITEFNVDQNFDKVHMADYVTATMAQFDSIAATYNIEAAQIFELLDESDSPIGETSYGISDSSGNPTVVTDAIQSYLGTNPSGLYGQ